MIRTPLMEGRFRDSRRRLMLGLALRMGLLAGTVRHPDEPDPSLPMGPNR